MNHIVKHPTIKFGQSNTNNNANLRHFFGIPELSSSDLMEPLQTSRYVLFCNKFNGIFGLLVCL